MRTSVAYTGPAAKRAQKIQGLRLLGDYTFSVTIDAEHIPYFYDISYASFSPTVLPLWLGESTIQDDGDGVYLSDDFYEQVELTEAEKAEAEKAEAEKAKEGEEKKEGPLKKYVMAEHIKASSLNADETYAYSGAYVVKKYDDTDKSVILERNPNFRATTWARFPQ